MKLISGLMGLIALSISLATAKDAFADDWPQWNGPNHDGKSTEKGLLAEWPTDGPELAWKATGFGRGYSGIAVVGDRLYTMGEKAGADWVVAASANGGKMLWSTKVGAPGPSGVPGYDFQGPRSTPTVDHGLIFALDASGEIICVNAVDGQEQWRRSLVKDLGGKPPTWGYSESPLVDGGQVVVTPGGKQGAIAAFARKTGELLWQTKEFTDAAHYSSIVPTEIDGIHQYVQLTAAHVVGLSAKDGHVLWKAPRQANVAVIPTPLVAGNEIYVTSGYGAGCNLFKVADSEGKLSVTQIYANHVMVNHHGGAVWVGEYIYGYSESKGLTCQKARTGEALWAEKEKIKKCSVSYADGKLYCREEDTGTVVLVEAASGGYVEKGRLNQPERSQEKAWTHPVIANGKLYLRDQDLLLCYDIKGGQ
jgi:outer membrane protein assembly factor BamB